ncbi:MAG: ABC transporter permease [Clostridiales Family XIII bacterium]|jgi:ribose transport system permease protein|nr:ABC transporter permease [Clostridiales Family XIII bacterium]
MLLRDAAYLGLVACGLSIVMIGGGIDLSVGGIVCAVGIICIRLSFAGLHGAVVVVLGVLIGALFGLLNGIVVSKIGLTEFVATLATGFAFFGMGLMFAYKDAAGVFTSVGIKSKSLLAFGHQVWESGLYPITVCWLVLTVVMYAVMHKTKFGLYTYAIGSNQKASAMSGIDVAKTKIIGFVLSGAFAGLAAVLVTAYNRTAHTSLGNGYEFQAIAACVVGGIVLGGGKGDAVSAFLGALFMLIVTNGINKLQLEAHYQYIVQGGLIVIAIAFDAQFAKFSYRRKLKEQRMTTVNP